MSVAGNKFTALTGGGAGALDELDGAALLQGDLVIVMVSGSLYFYELNSTSGATESSPDIIAPNTNAGTKRWILQRVPQTNSVPVGTIIPWQGGYYTNGSNSGFTNVIGDDATTINALVSTDGYRYLNGAALNLSGSPIYDGAGRYLPNLTDDRFLRGSLASGGIGGSNDYSHTHTTGDFTLTTNEIPSHYHTISRSNAGSSEAYPTPSGGASITTTGNTSSVGGGASHNHGSTGAASTVGGPKFLACHFLQKVI